MAADSSFAGSGTFCTATRSLGYFRPLVGLRSMIYSLKGSINKIQTAPRHAQTLHPHRVEGSLCSRDHRHDADLAGGLCRTGRRQGIHRSGGSRRESPAYRGGRHHRAGWRRAAHDVHRFSQLARRRLRSDSCLPIEWAVPVPRPPTPAFSHFGKDTAAGRCHAFSVEAGRCQSKKETQTSPTSATTLIRSGIPCVGRNRSARD